MELETDDEEEKKYIDQYAENLFNVAQYCKESVDGMVDLSNKIFGKRVY